MDYKAYLVYNLNHNIKDQIGEAPFQDLNFSHTIMAPLHAEEQSIGRGKLSSTIIVVSHIKYIHLNSQALALSI